MGLDMTQYTLDCPVCAIYEADMRGRFVLSWPTETLDLVCEAFRQGHHVDQLKDMPASEVGN